MKQFLLTIGDDDNIANLKLDNFKYAKIEPTDDKMFNFYSRDFVYDAIDSYFGTDTANNFMPKELEDIARQLHNKSFIAIEKADLGDISELSHEELEDIVCEIVTVKYSDKIEEM